MRARQEQSLPRLDCNTAILETGLLARRALPPSMISGYITGYRPGGRMPDTPQKRALKRYRKRLTARGMSRFEVLGLTTDRELIRSLARQLADRGPQAARIRTAVRRTISGEPPKKGGVLNA